VEDEELSQKMSGGSPDEVPEPRQNVLWELDSEDTPNDASDSMERSSYERFPFGLYDSDLFQTIIHQNKVSKGRGPSPPIEDCTLDWDSDSELLQDELSNRASQLRASTPDISLEPQDFRLWNGDMHLIESWPAGACDEISEHESLFALDEMENSASGSPTCDELWTTENLFAHEEPEGNQSTSNFSGCGPGILDTDNDIDLLSEASTESTSSILNLEP
jgi:hypothetical protein